MIHYNTNYNYERDQRMKQKYKGLPTEELKEGRPPAFSNEDFVKETIIAKKFIEQLKDRNYNRRTGQFTTNYDE